MSKNITYLLGAGASYNACPIWKEQGEKMIELAQKYLTIPNPNFQEKKPSNLTEQQDILWDIGYFGHKAIEYGTIDTYAKKLHINECERELQRLKLTVSVFFTLWESTTDTIKNRNGKPFQNIDNRYTSLLAALLEKNNYNEPALKNNIRFVTWNYDLQLERAFKTFCSSNVDWKGVCQYLTFSVNPNVLRDLEICHLNGYNGFYYIPKNTGNVEREVSFLNRTPSDKIPEVLEKIGFTSTKTSHDEIIISNHINFAWESNSLSNYTREQAIKIFSQTDILVIIGYSFPPFNKEIDSLLFEQLKNRETKIYYQDPYGSDELLRILTNGFNTQIFTIRDKTDHFFLPYEF